MNSSDRARLDLEPNTLLIPAKLLAASASFVEANSHGQRRTDGPPTFHSDIQQWCDEFLTAGRFSLEWHRAKYKTPDNVPVVGLHPNGSFDVVVIMPIIRFTDERDLIMFRLRWGDQ